MLRCARQARPQTPPPFLSVSVTTEEGGRDPLAPDSLFPYLSAVRAHSKGKLVLCAFLCVQQLGATHQIVQVS